MSGRDFFDGHFIIIPVGFPTKSKEATVPKTQTLPFPTRSISAIAEEIKAEWPKVYFGAVPYLAAMRDLDGINDSYGADDARSIVIYFLSNATTWRGEAAKRIKAELKQMVGR